MSRWHHTDEGKYYSVDEWFDRLPWDNGGRLNGFEPDDIVNSVDSLMWLLVKLKVIEWVSTEGELTIWMKN
jgi:hypothetical protein